MKHCPVRTSMDYCASTSTAGTCIVPVLYRYPGTILVAVGKCCRFLRLTSIFTSPSSAAFGIEIFEDDNGQVVVHMFREGGIPLCCRDSGARYLQVAAAQVISVGSRCQPVPQAVAAPILAILEV